MGQEVSHATRPGPRIAGVTGSIQIRDALKGSGRSPPATLSLSPSPHRRRTCGASCFRALSASCVMQILRQLTWLFLGGLHAGLLLALIGCAGTPPLDAGGPRSDTLPVDQGVTSEGKSKLAEPEPVIETSAIPHEESRPSEVSTRQQTPQAVRRVNGDPEQSDTSLRLATLVKYKRRLRRAPLIPTLGYQGPYSSASRSVLLDKS